MLKSCLIEVFVSHLQMLLGYLSHMLLWRSDAHVGGAFKHLSLIRVGALTPFLCLKTAEGPGRGASLLKGSCNFHSRVLLKLVLRPVT